MILWDISWYECPLRGFPDCTQPKTDHVDEMKTKNIGGGMTAGYVAELTKAIQEQQTIIEDLKSRIETLEG